MNTMYLNVVMNCPIVSTGFYVVQQATYKRGTGPTDNIYFVTSYFITHYDIVLTALSSTIYSDIQLVNRLFKLQCKYYYHVVSPF